MNKGLFAVLAIILVLAVAGASFYGGTVYGKAQAQANVRAAFVNGQGGFPGQGGAAGAGQRTDGQGNFVMGTIKEIGDNSLSVSDTNGKVTQVKVTDTTLIEKNMPVKLTDLAQGETAIISGSAAADGTMTARSVRVGQQGQFGPGGFGGRGGTGAAGGAAPQATPGQ